MMRSRVPFLILPDISSVAWYIEEEHLGGASCDVLFMASATLKLET